MKCKKCGAPISNTDLFCSGCGTSIEELKNSSMIETEEVPAVETTETVVEEAKVEAPVETPVEVTSENSTVVEEVKETSVLDGSFKEKKKVSPLLIVFGIVLLAILGVVAYYFFVFATPKNVFAIQINKAYNTLTKNMDSKIETRKGTFGLDLNITSNELDSDIVDLINKIDFDAEYAIDTKNSYYDITFNTKYDNDSLLSVQSVLKDNKAYFKLNDLYSKYISTDFDGSTEDIKNMNEVDFKGLVSSIKSALVTSMKDEYFTSSKDGKYTVNTLTLDEKEFTEVVTSMQKKLAKDKKFVKDLAKAFNMTEENIKDALNEKFEAEGEFEFKINIYTEGLLKDFAKIETVVTKDGETISAIVEPKGDKYDVEIKQGKTSVFKGSYEFKKDGKKETCNLTFGVSNTNVEIKMNSTEETNTKITQADVSNSIDSEDLTETDYQKIMVKLMSKEAVQNIYTKVTTMYNSLYGYNGYDDYEDYDY